MNKIAIIYDLDETILPASAVPDATFDPLFEAIKKANHGKVSDENLDKAFSEMKYLAIDVISDKYGFSKEMDDAAREVLCNSTYRFYLQPFEDYDVIKKIPGIKVLVTSGIVKLQQAKLDALEIEDDFDEVIIDDIYAENRPGKKEIFSRIAAKYDLNPDQVWIVGDNPDSEIAAGNELGMITVLRTKPEERKIKGEPVFTISSFYDLKKLVTDSLKINA
jgi:putative hydrolase of the HAD superfamily